MAHEHKFDNDPYFVIDPVTRVITNKSDTKKKLMQYDHNSERFTFEIPRFVDGHDMSACDKIKIHYININSSTKETSADVYFVDDVQLSPDDEEKVIFSWLISRNATMYAGSLNFLVRFVCVDGDTIEYAWGTDIYKGITIADGINNSAAVVEEYTDIFAAWERQIAEKFSGGGKLYIHTLVFGYDDLNTEPGMNPYDFTIQMISTDGTPITTPKQLSELRTRFQTTQGVFFDEFYVNGYALRGPYMVDTSDDSIYKGVGIDVYEVRGEIMIRFYYLDSSNQVQNVSFGFDYIIFSDQVAEV